MNMITKLHYGAGDYSEKLIILENSKIILTFHGQRMMTNLT